MFHVLLVLPITAAFGALAGAVLAVMAGLLVLGFCAELLLGLLCQRCRWLLWVPVLAGIFGLLLSLLWLNFSGPVKTAVVVFWGLYGLCLLGGWGLSWLLARVWRHVGG